MQRVVEAAARNGAVAIEINSRYRLPSPAFIRLAKQAPNQVHAGHQQCRPGDRPVTILCKWCVNSASGRRICGCRNCEIRDGLVLRPGNDSLHPELPGRERAGKIVYKNAGECLY